MDPGSEGRGLQFAVIGVDDGIFQKYLADHDPCFGKSFAKSAEECVKCVAPIVWQNKVYLMREACAAVTAGGTNPLALNRLTTQDIIRLLGQGQTVEEIFSTILGDAGEAGYAAARLLLNDRLTYMKSKGLPAPPLPPLKELVDALHRA